MIAPLRRTLAVLVLLAWSGAFAAPGATASREIEHLLSFVASSECRFVRGGTEHPGREARDHLLRKLEVARPLLGTADQFIDHVATGSSLTGEAYKVRCGTRELTSKEWLRTELERYRRSVKAP